MDTSLYDPTIIARGSSPGAIEGTLGAGARKVWASDPATRLRSISQPITSLVLGTGLWQDMPSRFVMRTIPMTAATGDYTRYDDTHVTYRDTRRALGAKIQRVRSSGTTITVGLDFRALAAEADILEEMISMAGGGLLREATRPIQLARFMVEIDREVQRHKVLTAAASYVGARDITLSGTSQWDSGTAGAVYDTVVPLADAVASAAHLPRGLVSVTMGQDAWNAARQDSRLLDRVANIGGVSRIMESDLASYLAVRSVNVADLYIDLRDGNGVQPLYGDVAFVHIDPMMPGTVPGVDTTYGHETAFVDFQWTPGLVGRPWFDDDTNSQVWPYHAASRAYSTSTAACGILRDVSAAA